LPEHCETVVGERVFALDEGHLLRPLQADEVDLGVAQPVERGPPRKLLGQSRTPVLAAGGRFLPCDQ